MLYACAHGTVGTPGTAREANKYLLSWRAKDVIMKASRPAAVRLSASAAHCNRSQERVTRGTNSVSHTAPAARHRRCPHEGRGRAFSVRPPWPTPVTDPRGRPPWPTPVAAGLRGRQTNRARLLPAPSAGAADRDGGRRMGTRLSESHPS